MKKHLYLIGYMGTGKSTVGKLLSEMLNLPLLEMDEILTSMFDMSISEIFDALGDDVFREAETLLLADIAALEAPSIVSCGGGVPLKSENRTLLRDSGNAILLNASPREILNRLSNCDDRPLLSDKNESEIENMLFERKAAYEEAAYYSISTDGLTPEEITMRIIELIENL